MSRTHQMGALGMSIALALILPGDVAAAGRRGKRNTHRLHSRTTRAVSGTRPNHTPTRTRLSRLSPRERGQRRAARTPSRKRRGAAHVRVLFGLGAHATAVGTAMFALSDLKWEWTEVAFGANLMRDNDWAGPIVLGIMGLGIGLGSSAIPSRSRGGGALGGDASYWGGTSSGSSSSSHDSGL